MRNIQLTTNNKMYHVGLLFLAIVFASFNTAAEVSQSKSNIFDVTVIGQGSPIILIPGLMSDGSVWQHIAKELSDKHQVHSISIAGFAGTPPVDNFSLEQVKEQLINYITTNKLKNPSVIGHSLGGFMGFLLASSTPDLIGKLISVDGLPFIAPVFTRTNDSTVETMASQAQYIRNMYQNMTPQQVAAQTQQGIFIQAKSQAAQQKIVQMALASDPKTVGESIYYLMSNDLRSQVENIKSPVLLIGASGAFTQTSQQQQVEVLYKQQLNSITKAQLIMTTQDRHFIMLDNPTWLLKRINDFLEG